MRHRLRAAALALSLALGLVCPARAAGEGCAKIWPEHEGLRVAARLLPALAGGDAPAERTHWDYELGILDAAGGWTPFHWEDTEAGTTSFTLRLSDPSGLEELDYAFREGYICLFNPDGVTSSLYDAQGQGLVFGDGRFFPTMQVTEGTVVTRLASGFGPAWYDLAAQVRFQADLSGHPEWKSSAAAPFCGGLAPAAVYWYVDEAETEPSERMWGFVDRTGAWVIEPAYTDFVVTDPAGAYQVFSDQGLALVRDADHLWGAIDRRGETAVAFTYDALTWNGDGTIACTKDGETGTLDPARLPALPAEPDPTPTPTVPVSQSAALAGEMDAWAVAEVTAAIDAALVPDDLQGSYRADIRRDEFCRLAVQSVSAIADKSVSRLVLDQTGKALVAWENAAPFDDCTDTAVTAAYALGIVNGRADGVFDPASSITREEAAAMLARSAKVLGLDTASSAPCAFTDRDAVSPWFTQSVDFVSAAAVMNGGADGRFDPKGRYTREQSYLTVYRLLQAVEKAR